MCTVQLCLLCRFQMQVVSSNVCNGRRSSSLCGSVLLFFFFKQKTAYEMRISDWSSDVCSSDLQGRQRALERGGGGGLRARADGPGRPAGHCGLQIGRASCRERVCQYV